MVDDLEMYKLLLELYSYGEELEVEERDVRERYPIGFSMSIYVCVCENESLRASP